MQFLIYMKVKSDPGNYFTPKGKAKQSKVREYLTGLEGSRRLRLPEQVVMSVLRIGRLYPPGNIPFYYRLNRPQGHNAIGRIMSTTLPGIEPATFWLVAQCLNQLRNRVRDIWLDG